MNQEIEEFIGFLEGTLIPDLKESGRECTAEDFEKAVNFMRQLMDRREPSCGMYLVMGTAVKKTRNGEITHQLPTFYLHPEVNASDINTAKKIAASIVNPTHNKNITPHISVELVSVASIS